MDFGDRLKAYLDEHYGGELRPLARKMAGAPVSSPDLAKWERTKRHQADIHGYAVALHKWRSKKAEPTAKKLKRLCEVTDTSADFWLFDNRPMFPWMLGGLTPDNARVLGHEMVRGIAAEVLKQRQSDIDTLDTFGDDEAHNEILDSAATMSAEWLGDLHASVRDHIHHQITSRIGGHVARATGSAR